MTPVQPDIPSLLHRYGLRPDKRLGQNFLIDPRALERIVEAAEITGSDTVLEIGSGLGNLTILLASRANKVISVELDQRLIPALQEVVAPFENVHIVQGNILELDTSQLVEQPNYKVVANIPYYLTSAIIRQLLEVEPKPASLTLTIQLEVAQRICASPGDMSLLALSVQIYGEARIVTYIPAGAFYPPPKVDSAVVKVDIHPSPLIPEPLIDTFFRLAKAGFSQKRKNLRNALAGGMHWTTGQTESVLRAANIAPKRRAQTLSLDEWAALSAEADRFMSE